MCHVAMLPNGTLRSHDLKNMSKRSKHDYRRCRCLRECCDKRFAAWSKRVNLGLNSISYPFAGFGSCGGKGNGDKKLCHVGLNETLRHVIGSVSNSKQCSRRQPGVSQNRGIMPTVLECYTWQMSMRGDSSKLGMRGSTLPLQEMRLSIWRMNDECWVNAHS